MAFTETAYAKINLALHVRRRREDGYHELETVFAFVDAGDTLSVSRAARDEFRMVGEFASQLTDPFSNIVMQALNTLPREDGWAVVLLMPGRFSGLLSAATGCRMTGANGRLLSGQTCPHAC